MSPLQQHARLCEHVKPNVSTRMVKPESIYILKTSQQSQRGELEKRIKLHTVLNVNENVEEQKGLCAHLKEGRVSQRKVPSMIGKTNVCYKGCKSNPHCTLRVGVYAQVYMVHYSVHKYNPAVYDGLKISCVGALHPFKILQQPHTENHSQLI